MNAKEFFDLIVEVETAVSELEDRLFATQKRFCMDAVGTSGDVSRLLYTHDANKREAAVRRLIEKLSFENDQVSSDFFNAGCDLTVVSSHLDALRQKFIDLWNGSVERHSDAIEQAKRETSQAHMQVRALQERKKEHAIHSPEVRAQVWAITEGRCIYCDVELTRERDPDDPQRCFVVDHVVPKAAGGPDHLTNYVPACASCNGGKAARPWFDFVRKRHAAPDLKIVGGSEA
jgi:hypothetical protein